MARGRLWTTFSAQARALKHQHRDRTECFIGIREWGSTPNVVFRLGRCRPPTKTAIALTVSPDLEWDQLVFRVQAVTIVNGSVAGVSVELLPVWCDTRGDRFAIETIPPIEEPNMAAFFLQRVERVLTTL